MSLELLWYFVIGVAVVFYVVLDGFDLGVGMLHCFTKKDRDRRIFLNAIGPVWDGNEVWLVIVGGALFAGFPDVYATLFSGFYDLCMLFLVGLIFRAVGIEFRSKRESMRWRKTWDAVFCASSYIIAFGLGVVLGNLMEGIPLNANKDFIGDFGLFLRPYPLLIGLFTVALLMMHGAIFLAMKTEGELHKKLRLWANRCTVAFIATYVATTAITWVFMPHLVEVFHRNPSYLLLGLIVLLIILNVPREFSKNRDGRAFIYSSLCILTLFALYGVGTFPYLVRSNLDPENNSLTFYNSAASQPTLTVLLLIVAIGVPLVLAYGALIYRVFRGKVKLGPSSY
ncbi:MAG: cytochrome d ubiquinol oxidase subunit II [Verrucomicrobia bacterium]|nr:cytochrome d ubiquinol oxidase subunit II [Verrucomicrobiota bacterium]